MEPISLFLMAAGSTFEAIQNYRRLKKEKKDIKRQIAELESQKNYELRMSGERQLELVRGRERDIGENIAGTVKAGLRLGGSAARRREAIYSDYERAGELTRLETSEQVRRMSIQQYLLQKRAKSAGKAAKWSLLTGLLGGTAQAGMGAYKAGLFSNKPQGVNYQKLTPTLLGDIEDWWQFKA